MTTSLNKKAIPCKNYVSDETDFNSCCKKVFTEFIANNSNCTAPGIFQMILKFEVRINFTQTLKGFWLTRDLFNSCVKLISKVGCFLNLKSCNLDPFKLLRDFSLITERFCLHSTSSLGSEALARQLCWI